MVTPARATIPDGPVGGSSDEAPVAVRYTGPLGEVYAFPAGRRRTFPAGAPVELTSEEAASMLTHPEFEPVPAKELAQRTTPAPTQED